ncbi:hypothetical protein ACP70R_007464 [Stipagrostis hirtigluma subsp. patula]
MDRSWIRCRLFSKPYLDGVNDFMKPYLDRVNDFIKFAHMLVTLLKKWLAWNVPLTEYEKSTRVAKIIRNNQMLQSLGIPAISAIVNNTNTKRKPTAPTNSGSLYEPGDDDDNEEGIVDKVSKNATMPTGGSRASKRVMAPHEQDPPARVTRQRVREQSSAGELQLLSPSAATEDALMAANSPSQADDQIQLGDEGVLDTTIDRLNRGRSMGKELDRINRSICTKLPVHVAEGMKRPEVPMQAAKLASEGGIVLRQHTPILTRWKDYKEDESHLDDYMGKVKVRVTLDTDQKAVKDACADLLKSGVRQMRYRLKKKYFDNVPANEVRTTSPLTHMTNDQWRALVEMWSSSKHKDNCEKNKANREKVQFQQRTGSRSYIAHCYALAREVQR